MQKRRNELVFEHVSGAKVLIDPLTLEMIIKLKDGTIRRYKLKNPSIDPLIKLLNDIGFSEISL